MKLESFLFLILMNLWLMTAAHAEEYPATGQQDFSRFSGPYLGLSPPKSGAEVFLPDLVTTGENERCVTFLDSGRLLLFTTDRGGTRYTWLNGERWMPAQPVPFNYHDDMIDYTAGPDDRSLVFMTSRPVDDTDEAGTLHLWTIDWLGSKWGQPTPLPVPRKISGLGSGYPTLSSDGSLYFISDTRDGTSEGGIFRTRLSAGSNSEARLVPAPVNTEYTDYDPYVAPDGRFLIFTSNRPGGQGEYDNYIVFREKDGSWSPAFNLGSKLNSEQYECCPNVTADGKLFFFASRRPTEFLKDDNGKPLPTGRDVYWASADFIKKMEMQYRASADSQ